MTPTLGSLRRTLCTAGLLALLAIPLGAQEPSPAPAPADPEARLLEAELLELAEGKLDEAIEVYRALLATPELSPPLRARALFSIARAHRKRGELGAAKEIYEELIAQHPDRVELVEAARRYLEEIEEGAERLPEFDWVAEVEQNPQIQAQIFEWGMQLGGRGETAKKEAEEARRKLLSLGVIVVPILEPMLENSRDPAHREELAAVLIRLGRIRHIETYVEHSNDAMELQDALEDLPPGEQSEALRILSQLPDDVPRHRWFAATTRLVLGVPDSVESDLLTVVELNEELRGLGLRFGFGRIAPALLPAARESFPELAQASLAVYRVLLTNTLKEFPAIVEAGDLEPVLSAPEDLDASLLWALQEHRTDLLLVLLQSEMGETVYEWARTDRNRRIEQAYRDAPTAEKARICRQVGLFDELRALALADAGAVPEYEEHLMEREDVADRRRSLYPRPAPHVRQRTEVPGAWLTPVRAPDLNSPPHDAFEAALRRVVERGTDRSGRLEALEDLARLHRTNQEETHALLLAIAGDRAADPDFRVIALAGILLRLPDHEERRAELVSRVDAICEEFMDGKWLGRYDAAEGELIKIGDWHIQLSEGTDPVSIVAGVVWGLDSARESGGMLGRVRSALSPSIPRGQGVRLYRALHAAVRQFHPELIGESARPLAAVAGDIEDPALLRSLAAELLDIPWDPPSPPIGVWERIVEDPEIPADLRAGFLYKILPAAQSAQSPEAEFLRGIDWRALILGADPIAEQLIRFAGLAQFLRQVRSEARGAPRIEVQRWAWRSAPLPDIPEELEQALTSSDAEVRGSAYRSLLTADDTRWLPLLHRAVRDAPTEYREQAIDRLAFFADESSLPVLTALLDDPVFAVRAAALEALESIESVLEKQEKWRERFGKKKD